MLRGTAGGEGDTLIRFLCCGYFLTPPSCGHLPYILYCKTPRNTTGHGREEVNTLRCIVFVFLPYISLRKHPVMLRGTAGGEGDTLIRFLCCGYFLTPPSCGHLPYILYCKTPRNTTGHGREEVNTLRCIVFVFPPPIFPYGNTP